MIWTDVLVSLKFWTVILRAELFASKIYYRITKNVSLSTEGLIENDLSSTKMLEPCLTRLTKHLVAADPS